ncbi:hypothetical protein HRbin23_00005 [bacterium HR23]|nr:hypothetical protein HRbin23_00005 [bacterium HR23]
MRAATSFGGGVALSKGMCGCVSAAAMALGMAFGSTEPTGTAPRSAYARARAFLEAFRKRFGTITCGTLTAPWERDFANPQRVYRCAELVDFTVREVQRILHAPPEEGEATEPWWDTYLTRRDKVEPPPQA